MYTIENMKEFIKADEFKTSSYYDERYSVFVLKNQEFPLTADEIEKKKKPLADFLIITREGNIIGQVVTRNYTSSGFISDEIIMQAIEIYQSDPDARQIGGEILNAKMQAPLAN